MKTAISGNHSGKRKWQDCDYVLGYFGKGKTEAMRKYEVSGIKPEEVFLKGRQVGKVKARSLLCFWAARELGIPHTKLAKKLEMSLTGIGFSVERGEALAKNNNYSLEK